MASLASGQKWCIAHILKNQKSSLKHNDSLLPISQLLRASQSWSRLGASVTANLSPGDSSDYPCLEHGVNLWRRSPVLCHAGG